MTVGYVAVPEWLVLVAVGMIGLGLTVVLGTLFAGPKRAPLSVEERVALAASGQTPHGKAAGSRRAEQEDVFASSKAAAAAVLRRNTSLEERIAARLESAGSGFRASEWLLLHASITVVAGLAGLVVGRGSVVTGLLFVGAGVLGPWLFLGLQRRRRFKKFNAQLPDTLQLMSGSLAAGLSLAQSVDTIVNEGTEPMASEFKRVLVETRLGVELEDAMDGIVERFESKDFGWVVMAIRIQRQVGGNLAELLGTVAATIREREYMRRQVSALSAEGRLSAYILGGLPPGFMLYLWVTRPEYLSPMFTEPIGILMLGAGLTMLGIGCFWLSRMVKVEV